MKKLLVIFLVFLGLLVLAAMLNPLFVSEIDDVAELEKIEGVITAYDRFQPKKTKSSNNPYYRFQLEGRDELIKLYFGYTDCFDQKSFDVEVGPGDKIIFRKTEKDGLFRNGTIVSIQVNGKEYLDLTCVNENR